MRDTHTHTRMHIHTHTCMHIRTHMRMLIRTHTRTHKVQSTKIVWSLTWCYEQCFTGSDVIQEVMSSRSPSVLLWTVIQIIGTEKKKQSHDSSLGATDEAENINSVNHTWDLWLTCLSRSNWGHICLSVRLPVCLFTCLSGYLSVRLHEHC